MFLFWLLWVVGSGVKPQVNHSLSAGFPISIYIAYTSATRFYKTCLSMKCIKESTYLSIRFERLTLSVLLFVCRFVAVKLSDIRKEVQCPICLGISCDFLLNIRNIRFQIFWLAKERNDFSVIYPRRNFYFLGSNMCITLSKQDMMLLLWPCGSLLILLSRV